jgi:hypothetical protein
MARIRHEATHIPRGAGGGGLGGEAAIRALPFPRIATAKDIDGNVLIPHPHADDLPSVEDRLTSSHSRSSSAVPSFAVWENREVAGLRAE